MSRELSVYPQMAKYDFTEIRDLIENNFRRDWAIRIEYATTTPENETEWNRWAQVHFAVDESDPVIHEIIECCKANPECSMKMVCEHFQPECKFIYFLRRRDQQGQKQDQLTF